LYQEDIALLLIEYSEIRREMNVWVPLFGSMIRNEIERVRIANIIAR
jgi:hypothetical protein